MTQKTEKPPERWNASGAENNEKVSPFREQSISQSGPKSTPKRSQRWKNLERCAARKLGGKRIVREYLFEVAPDVLVPDFGLVIEAKAYKKFAHHTLLETSQRKYCHDGEVMVLVTKHENQVGEYATLSLDQLAALLDEVRESRRRVSP